MRNVGRLNLIARCGTHTERRGFVLGKSNCFWRSFARACLLRTREDGIVRVEQKLVGSDGGG